MMVKIEQQTHDWIATVRALGLQLGEPNVVNDKDKVIKKCIDYLSMRPKELLLDGKNISADTRAIVDREYIDVLVGNKAYNQKFLHYSGSHDGPVELSLSDDNGKNSALKKVAGDKSAPENTLGYEVPKLLLDVDKFSKKNNGFLHLNRDQCETYFTENTPPASCIVLPMDFSDEGHLGYFILKHPTDEDFFKFEHLNLLANIITNASARSIRRIQWGNRTHSLIKFASFLENSTSIEESFYIQKLYSELKTLYGDQVQVMLFLRNRMNGEVEEQYYCSNSSGFKAALGEEHYQERLKNLAKAFILSQEMDSINYIKDFITNYNPALDSSIEGLRDEQAVQKKKLAKAKKEIPVDKDEISARVKDLEQIQQLIDHKEKTRPIFETPAEIKFNAGKTGHEKQGFHTGVIIALHRKAHLSKGTETDSKLKDINSGCLVFRGVRLKEPEIEFLDAITDLLARKLHRIREAIINNEMDQFKKATKKPENHNEKKLLELISTYVGKVMYSDNLFVALKNEQQEIKFPVFIINNESQPETVRVAEWDVDLDQPRRFDPESKEKGRVEVILDSGEPIIIHTLSESKQWYDPALGREEKIGDPYSSWVGVPLLYIDQVIGVIAVFHKKEEYLYYENHIHFLERLSEISSALLTNIRLEEALNNNTELQDAQIKIADQQHVLSTSLLSQDLIHRVNNTVGAAYINTNQAIEDIQLAQETKDLSHFDFTLSVLQDTDLMLKRLAKDIKDISSNKTLNINIDNLVRKIIGQISIEKMFSKNKIKINILNEGKIPLIRASNRALFNALYAVLDNAANALLTSVKEDIDRDLVLTVILKKDEKYVSIEITDNGKEIPSEIEKNIFLLGISGNKSSGFGLWRAESIVNNLGGKLYLKKNHSEFNEKCFVINLPYEVNFNAIVLDDENSWRNIISTWLKNLSFVDVKTAKNLEEMKKILLSTHDLDNTYIFLDISMDAADGANYNGLSIIDFISDNLPSCKKVIVTGYPDAAGPYEGKYDLLIPKINNNGEILSKDIFCKSISDLKESHYG